MLKIKHSVEFIPGVCLLPVRFPSCVGFGHSMLLCKNVGKVLKAACVFLIRTANRWSDLIAPKRAEMFREGLRLT